MSNKHLASILFSYCVSDFTIFWIHRFAAGEFFLEIEKCEAMGPSGAEVNNDERLKIKTSHNEGLESDLIAELSRKYECDFERSVADE